MTLQDLTRFGWIQALAKEPILDVGCADSAYFDETVDFVGFDKQPRSPDMKQGKPIEFVEGDAHSLPFDDNEFNTVLTAEILEHVDNPVQVLSEAYRVAANQLLITVPDESRWLEGADPHTHIDHKREYTGKMLADHIKEAGVEYDRVKIDHLNELPFAFWVAIVNAS